MKMQKCQLQTQKFIQNQQQASLKAFNQEQSQLFRQLSSYITPKQQAQSIQLTYSVKGQRNLSVKRQFKENQVIFSISFNQIIDQTHFNKSKFCQYLYWLNKNPNKIPSWKILGEYQSQMYLKQFVCEHSTYNLMPQICIFQLKFMTKYQSSNESIQKNFMWFTQYVKILPQDFSYMPHHFIHIIQKYHKQLALSLQEFYESLRHAYELLKDLIYGKNIAEQWSFLNFLKTLQQDYDYYYHKYCHQFTFDNFQWAYLNWKTRSFDRETNNCVKISFVPIIDMINHSKTLKNAQWVFSQSQQKLILKAKNHINAFQELFIDYGQRSMQQFFQNYGFLQEQQKCFIKLQIKLENYLANASFYINRTLSIEQIILYLKNQHFSKITQSQLSLYCSKLNQSISRMKESKLKVLQYLENDSQNIIYTYEEISILNQVKVIIQNEAFCLNILESAIKMINLQ